MLLGVVLMGMSATLFVRNQQEQQRAAETVVNLMPQLVDAIREQKAEEPIPEETAPTTPQKQEMTVVEIDGHDYIGFVGIPDLNLELPVMADWTYPQLQIAPCRFTGSVYTGDLVIMAHNYEKHFGKLKDLRTGATVTFTDMDGQTLHYAVAALDVLGPDDVENMTSGEFDLTLFTCTYGGQSRVTLRCDRVSG